MRHIGRPSAIDRLSLVRFLAWAHDDILHDGPILLRPLPRASTEPGREVVSGRPCKKGRVQPGSCRWERWPTAIQARLPGGQGIAGADFRIGFGARNSVEDYNQGKRLDISSGIKPQTTMRLNWPSVSMLLCHRDYPPVAVHFAICRGLVPIDLGAVDYAGLKAMAISVAPLNYSGMIRMHIARQVVAPEAAGRSARAPPALAFA